MDINNKGQYMNSSKYNLKKGGLFFVFGQGFTASCQAQASALTQENITCLSGLGYSGFETLPVTKSYAVAYIRKDDELVDGVLVQKPGNPALNQIVPSKRRFATEDEAWQHGTRARQRRADRGDKPGTAGHKGFFIVVTSDPVNAKVNWKTGLTNPVTS